MITFFYLQKPDGPCYARMKHHQLPNGSEGHLTLSNAALLHLLPGSSYAESLHVDQADETFIRGEALLQFTQKGSYVLFADDLEFTLTHGKIHVIAYPECRHLFVQALTAEVKLLYRGNRIVLEAGQALLIDKQLRMPFLRQKSVRFASLNCLPLDICIAILSRKFDCKIELATEIDQADLVLFNRKAAKLRQALEPVCEQLNLKMSMHEANVKLSL